MSATNKYIQIGYSTITPYLFAKLDLVDFLKNAFGCGSSKPYPREIAPIVVDHCECSSF